MNERNPSAARILSALGLPLLMLGLTLAAMGCFGYVQGDGGGVAVEPDMFWFGGYFDGGRARDYGRRGAESRGFAGHPGRASGAPAGRTTVVPSGRGGGGRR